MAELNVPPPAPHGPPPAPDEWDRKRIRSFREALLAHFRASARTLPWRTSPDPWAVLVSEFMLQQTRVETALPYFRRWMARFPTAEALASSPEEAALEAWAGLGYYRRARYLHRAARDLVARHGGRVPADPGALRSLPGVGAYTAGAVASIAFGVPVPAIDGNARRVLARLANAPDPSPAELERWASRLLPPDAPGAFNQALMELGSRLCTPRSPDCRACPVATHCAARAEGTQEARPRPKPRGPVPRLEETVLVLLRSSGEGGEFLLRRRPAEGLLGGMWEFPGIAPASGEAPARTVHRIEEALLPEGPFLPARRAGCTVRAGADEGAAARRSGPSSPADASGLEVDGSTRGEGSTDGLVPLDPFEHVFSHRRVRYIPFLKRVLRTPSDDTLPPGLRWVPAATAPALPLPAAQLRIWNEAWARTSGGPAGPGHD